MLNGKVVIISAPSGAGKSTIVNFLLKVFTNLSFSVSVTTRKIRTDEKEGRDYYFISKEEFKKLILENKFVEWEEVYDGDFKGTLKSEVDSIISKKKHIIFDVDVKGGLSLKKYFGKSGLSIFINVSSIDILKKRLINRGTESNEEIEERLLKAKEEFTLKNKFDLIIDNDDLSDTLKNLKNTVQKFINNYNGNWSFFWNF